MSQNLKTLLKRPEGKLILACIAMVLVWGGIFVSMSSSSSTLLPAEADFEQVRSDLRRLKAENQSLNQKRKEYEAVQHQAFERLGTFWIVPRDGEVEYKLREMLDTAIRSQKDVTLSSLGSVRTAKINGALFYADLDVTFTGSLEDILTVLENIESFQPRMAWKRVDFRLDFQRRPPNSQDAAKNNASSTGSADTGNKAKTSNTVKGETVVADSMRFNATVRVICSDAMPGSEDRSVTSEKASPEQKKEEGAQKK